MEHIDNIVLNFNEQGLLLVNITLAFIMFGIALDLKIQNFKDLAKYPKAFFTGLFSQLILLPLLTYLLILAFQPMPSMALGMMLVAACPGGNISNFMSSLANANVALSIGMTSVVSILAILLTPFNLQLYGNLYEPTREILQQIHLNWYDVAYTILLIIVIPLILGMIVNHKFSNLSKRIHKIFKVASIVIFMLIVLAALIANYELFFKNIHHIFLIVFIHNMIAMFTGFSIAKLFSLNDKDVRTLTIETGIQNSGLGLVLIFGFFQGLGGMAIIAAWWGIWHIISGLAISYYWSKRY